MSTSLSRAFTTRRTANKPSKDVESSVPQRSLTTKNGFSAGAIRARKISAPIELISTTNMLSYNAPDIYPRSRSSTQSSNSDGRSLNSARSDGTSPSSVGTPFTSPESSSVESSPTSALPEPNHLSCYFGTVVKSPMDEEAPKIPQRAVSHTKKSAEYLARKRSISRMASPKNSMSISSSKHSLSISSPMPIPSPNQSFSMSRTSSTSKHSTTLSTARSSINMFSPNPETMEKENPFGKELAQVSELAEEYKPSGEKLLVLPVVNEEEQELVAKGLFKFAAEDYVSDIQSIFSTIFSDVHVPKPLVSAAWI